MEPTQNAPIVPEVRHSNKTLILWIIAAITVLVVGVLVFFVRTTGANADYICTKTITVDSACTNGSWSNWETVSSTTTNGVLTTVERRVYTGTRTLSKTLEYLNLRTACQAGYTQQDYGSGGGNSGFHGGGVTTVDSACQIAQTQTVTRTVTTGGTGGTGGSTGSTVITTTGQDTGGQNSNRHDVGSLDELNAQDNGNGSGTHGFGDITGQVTAKPSLVRSGNTTTVTWSATGVNTCTLTSNGGDSWTGLSGTQVSSPIRQQTTFTLRCPLDGGTDLTASSQVDVAPNYTEQ